MFKIFLTNRTYQTLTAATRVRSFTLARFINFKKSRLLSFQYMGMSTSHTELPKPEIIKTDDEWRKELTPQEYEVCRRKGTERAFTGALWNNKEPGIYKCTCCGTPLFSSDTKFDSGTGWPSFWDPIKKENVLQVEDHSIPRMPRIEVLCAKCHSHLGHVFNDGPREHTGKRYCMNSCSLKFEPKK